MIKLWILFKSCALASILWPCSSRWRGMLPDVFQVEVHVLHWTPLTPQLDRSSLLVLSRDGSSGCSPGFHSHHPGWEGCLVTARWWWKSLLPTRPSLTHAGGYVGDKGENLGLPTWLLQPEGGMGLLFCLWGVVGGGLLLAKSFLTCRAIPSLVLWLETADLPWGCFLCVSVGVSGLPASSRSSLGYVRQKENPELNVLPFLCSWGP